MPKITVKIVVDDAHMDRPGDVQRRLEDQGLHVERAIPEVGVYFGTVEASQLPGIASTEGVASAAMEGGVQLPPLSPLVPQ